MEERQNSVEERTFSRDKGDGIATGMGMASVSENSTNETPKPQARRVPHLHKLEKKHSSGDLHSRLKTRKLLGVGETDDGDVHRSKLSQILGHSDQLYVRLPPGLRIWQVLLAVLFSLLALWAFIFPTHMFTTVFEADEGNFVQLPVRLYGIAMICLSLMYWYTINTVDKDMIRLILLCSIVFFTLQTIVTFMTLVSHGLLSKCWFSFWALCILCSVVTGFYHWALGYKPSTLKRSASNKELEKEHEK